MVVSQDKVRGQKKPPKRNLSFWTFACFIFSHLFFLHKLTKNRKDIYPMITLDLFPHSSQDPWEKIITCGFNPYWATTHIKSRTPLWRPPSHHLAVLWPELLFWILFVVLVCKPTYLRRHSLSLVIALYTRLAGIKSGFVCPQQPTSMEAFDLSHPHCCWLLCRGPPTLDKQKLFHTCDMGCVLGVIVEVEAKYTEIVPQ